MQDIIITAYLKDALVKSPQVEELVEILFDQCYELPDDVAKERPSYLNFSKTLQWKGDIINGYIASLAALNSQHGCFTACYDFIEKNIIDYEYTGEIIPGFGNPVRDGKDPRCVEIEAAFSYLPKKIVEPILTLRDSVISSLSTKGDIRENLVFWNAAIAYSLGLSVHYAPLVFILATQLRYIHSLKKD